MNSEVEAILSELVDRYYTASDWEEQAEVFFQIVSVYNKLAKVGYRSKEFTVVVNIIALG